MTLDPTQPVARSKPPRPSLERDLRWGEHLIYMEAGAELAAAAPDSTESPRRTGLVFCALLAAAALAAERVLGGSSGPLMLDATMIAMLLGIALGNTGLDPALWRSGARWVMRVVLPAGIMLLGARMDWSVLAGVGLRGLALSLGVILLSGAVLYALFRWRDLDPRLAALLAAGNGICGGSAIVALAPTIEADEEQVALSTSTVALLGLVTMLALPPLGRLLGMDPVAFGTWCGLAIQQTPQVIAAAFNHGPEAGEAATVVKLVRIALLAPIVFLAGLAYRKRFAANRERSGGRPWALIPNFAVGLVVFTGLASFGLLPSVQFGFPPDSVLGERLGAFDTQELAVSLSRLALILSMTAVGLETRWEALRRTGPAAFTAASIGALVIVAASLVATY